MSYNSVVDSVKLNNKLKLIANKIRNKTGKANLFNFYGTGFEDAIDSIETKKPEQAKNKRITSNGSSIILPDSGKVLNKVTIEVDVPSQSIPSQEKTVEYTKNANYEIIPDIGYTISKATVKVNVPSFEKTEIEGNGNVTENGQKTFIPDEGYVYSKFIVSTNVPTGGGGGGFPNIITPGDTPIASSTVIKYIESESLIETGVKLIIPKNGKYRLKWSTDSIIGIGISNSNSQLKKNGIFIGEQINKNGNHFIDVDCLKGDSVEIFCSRGSARKSTAIAGSLCACINWTIT